MGDCIICAIVRRQTSAWVVYEDDRVICFLPLELNAYGHTIIAPVAHHADLYDAPEDVLQPVIATAKRLSSLYRERIGATGVNLLHASGQDAQQSILHFHLHLLPRFGGDGLDAWPALPALPTDKDQLLRRLRMD